MDFTVNYDAQKSFEIIPEGTVLEAIVTSVTKQDTPGGYVFLRANFQVRDDLDNALESNKRFKNRYVNASFWPDKDSGEYKGEIFLNLLQACEVPEGTKITEVEQIEGLVKGKAVKVKVGITKNKDDKEFNNVAFFNINKSDYPIENPFEESEVNNEDLPF